MTWTTEKPTEPGLYWYKDPDGYISICEICLGNMKLRDPMMLHCFNIADDTSYKLDSLGYRQWGPKIEMPEDSP